MRIGRRRLVLETHPHRDLQVAPRADFPLGVGREFLPQEIQAARGLHAVLARSAEQQIAQALAAEARRGRRGCREAHAAGGILGMGERPGALLHHHAGPHRVAPIPEFHVVGGLQGRLDGILGIGERRDMQLQLAGVVPELDVRHRSGILSEVVEPEIFRTEILESPVSVPVLAREALHGEPQRVPEARGHGVRKRVLGMVG